MAAELESTRHTNVYDAVRQLRPFWLARRGTRTRGTPEQNILVYLDDQPIGNAFVLRQFSLDVPAKLRYMTPTEAQVRYGPNNGLRAAIVIESAKP